MAIVITGASTGIGYATATRLAARGHRVVAAVRKHQDAERLRSEGLTTVLLDVSDAAQIADAAATVAQLGGATALVNNAGIAAAAPLEFIPIDEFRNQLEINVVGPLAVTQAFLPQLRATKGRVVNISSIGGLVSGAMLGPYHASKFALEAMTDTMRGELAPWGIEVIAVEPGQISTPIWSTSSRRAETMLGQRQDDAEALYGARMQAARDGAIAAERHGLDPDEVAKVIERALTAKRPRTRYRVGRDAKLVAAVVRRLPDRTRDRLLSR